MKKFLAIFLILSVVVLTASLAFSQQKINLTGTWKGATTANGDDFEIPLTFTLVLDQKTTKLTGKLKDDWGYVNCSITDCKIKDDVLTFKAIAQSTDGDIDIEFELNVQRDTLDGEWIGHEGTYGSWKAVREKAAEINLTGSWAGSVYAQEIEDLLTGEFKQENEKITGTLNTESGSLNNAVIKNGKMVNGKLYMETILTTPGGEETLIIKGTVKGKSISGDWQIPSSGETGTWKLSKKVKN